MLTLLAGHHIIQCIQADIITEKKTELTCTVYFTSLCQLVELSKYLGETTIECPVNTNIVRINCRI